MIINKFSIGSDVEITNDCFYGMMIGTVMEHHGLCSVIEINERTLGKHKIVVRNAHLRVFDFDEEDVE